MTNFSPPRQSSPYQSLNLVLKCLKLSPFLAEWAAIEQRAIQEHWSYAQFLLALAEGEANRRDQARITRALSEAHLPYARSLTNFEFAHLPSFKPAMLMPFIEDSAWLAWAENLLLFGPAAVGKTHLSSGGNKTARTRTGGRKQRVSLAEDRVAYCH